MTLMTIDALTYLFVQIFQLKNWGFREFKGYQKIGFPKSSLSGWKDNVTLCVRPNVVKQEPETARSFRTEFLQNILYLHEERSFMNIGSRHRPYLVAEVIITIALLIVGHGINLVKT